MIAAQYFQAVASTLVNFQSIHLHKHSFTSYFRKADITVARLRIGSCSGLRLCNPNSMESKYQGTTSSLDDVHAFLNSKGCSKQATKIA